MNGGPVEAKAETQSSTGDREEAGQKDDGSTHLEDARTVGERVRVELRNRLGRVGDEVFDQDDSAEARILDEEEVVRGTPGLGALWKFSLCATVSFAAYVLFSGPHFEPKWIPSFTERDVIPKIYRPPRQRGPQSSSRPG